MALSQVFSVITFYLIAHLCFTTFPTISSSSSLVLPLFAIKHYLNISSFDSSLLLNATIRGQFPLTYTHVVEVGVGTPITPLRLTLDTGTQVTWVASDASCRNKRCTGFEKESSRTASSVYCKSKACQILRDSRGPYASLCRKDGICEETVKYVDGVRSRIELIRDILIFGEISSSVIFGYGISGNGRGDTDGVLGMGQGRLSMMEQFYFTLYSYCLPPLKLRSRSTLIFEDPSFPNDYKTMNFSTIGFLPHFYYLPISGISVDGVMLPMSKEDMLVKGDGSGGFILDTGASVTQLIPSMYKKFTALFEKHISSSIHTKVFPELNIHCYDVLYDYGYEVHFPEVAIHFQNGIKLKLPMDNVLVEDPYFAPYTCLAFLPSTSKRNILGSYQQQTFRFALDLNEHIFGVKLTPECNL